MKCGRNILPTTLIALFSIFLVQCKKDKVPVPDEQSIWSKITGKYNVYDTSWNYLYQMDISYKNGNDPNTDTLCFDNFDNLFDFNKWQSPWGVMPENYLEFGSIDSLIDKNNNRWNIYQDVDSNFNIFKNDTIHIKFFKSNLLFYIEDLTPYFSGWVEQYAVKQH